MIQNRLNDKEKDIQGLKKQTSSLLNYAWEKGYVAGFDDGYKTGRQAEQAPKGEWGDVFHHQGFNYHKCSYCHIAMRVSDYDNYCPNCGVDMRGEA